MIELQHRRQVSLPSRNEQEDCFLVLLILHPLCLKREPEIGGGDGGGYLFLEHMVTSFVCELSQENALSLELVLASERGKWYEESRKTCQDQWRSLLATAHREWSRAQEAVTKAEVERARRQWEKKQGRVVQVRVRKGRKRANLCVSLHKMSFVSCRQLWRRLCLERRVTTRVWWGG